jgi:hypothetical protein
MQRECKDEKMDFADKTIHPLRPCQLCSSCQQLTTIPDEQVLHVIKTDAEWRGKHYSVGSQPGNQEH